MSRAYARSQEQLVVEIHVSDLRRSVAFYRRFGFTLVSAQKGFCVLAWDGSQLFLEEIPARRRPRSPAANVRVMVPDADQYWKLAKRLKVRVLAPIADRYYGLRDFTVADPDGFGVRFGTWLRKKS